VDCTLDSKRRYRERGPSAGNTKPVRAPVGAGLCSARSPRQARVTYPRKRSQRYERSRWRRRPTA
jgi:hypothetical protein